MPLLETQALHGRYGQIEAIHGVDISVERGAIVRKRKRVNRAATGRARRLAAQEIAQPVKFENVFRCARHVC